jgi:hypothetical protein
MAPDRNPKRTPMKNLATNNGEIEKRTRPSPNDQHQIVFFQRHILDDINESTPGQDFLNEICPEGVRRTLRAVLIAVAKAPPKRFAGGGYWEAMHGEMSGWYEVRVDGPKRRHYRLFCLLDYVHPHEPKPLLVVVTGLSKLFKTQFDYADYAKVRKLGSEYKSRRLE